MMFLKVFVVVFSLMVICESAFVDTLFKCAKDDTECQAKLIKTAILNMANGVPEYDIPAIDPMILKNFKLSILEVDITLIDGVLKGIKKCVINQFTPNLDAGVAKLNITCSVVVEGTYEVFSKNPLLRSVLGSEKFHGNGDGKVKIQQLNMNMELPFKVVKRGEDIFLAKKGHRIPFTYKILGKVTFAANKLILGDTESSENIIKLLNENWKTLIEPFGKDIMKTVVKIIDEFLTKFFINVPASYYFIDDLTPYVEN